jgi:hypothetical protein
MNLYIPKNCSYVKYFSDPAPHKEKQLSIVYLNINNDEMQTIVNSNSEVALIQVKTILRAFYGDLSNSKEVDVTDKVSKLLTKETIIRNVTNINIIQGNAKNHSNTEPHKEPLDTKKVNDCVHCPEPPLELPPKGTKMNAYIWKPSGGLGHCLHNLAWMCNKVKEDRCKLYIYGCENHIPLQIPFSEVFEIIDKSIQYEEVKNLSELCKKYNLTKEQRTLIEESDYKAGLKYLKSDKSLAFVCATWSNRLDNMIRIKKDYIRNTLNKPLKYFNKSFSLINGSQRKKMKKFEIVGSYVAALGVTNKHLKIDAKDTKLCSTPKTLVIKYKNRKGEVKVEEIKEKTNHTINDISEIIVCTYGLPDRVHDVTEKVIKNLCIYEESKIDFEKQMQKIQGIINSGMYIAVHYRGRDKKAQGGEKKKLREINELCNANNINHVFVATDCPKFYDYLCKNTQGLTIFRYTNPPNKGFNVHYNTRDFKCGENIYKTILDLTICIKAKFFIPSNGSGMSTLVKEFSKTNYL